MTNKDGVISLLAFIAGLFFRVFLYKRNVTYYLEVLVWLAAVIVLYMSPKQLFAMLGISLAVALTLKVTLPFGL